MKDVIVKLNSLVCWNCHTADQFISKRTARAKLIGGFAALATSKKLKCLACGEYNQVGNSAKAVPTEPKVSKTDIGLSSIQASTDRMKAKAAARPSFKEQVALAKAKRAEKGK